MNKITSKLMAIAIMVAVIASILPMANVSAKTKASHATLQITEDSGKKTAYTVPYSKKWTLMSSRDRMLSFTGSYKGAPYTVSVVAITIPEEYSETSSGVMPVDIAKRFSKSKKAAVKAMNECFADPDLNGKFSVAKDGNGKYMVICDIPLSDDDASAQYHIYRFVDDRHMIMYMVGVPMEPGKYVPKSIKKLIKAYVKGVKPADSRGSSQPSIKVNGFELKYNEDWELVTASTKAAYFTYDGYHINFSFNDISKGGKQEMIEMFSDGLTDDDRLAIDAILLGDADVTATRGHKSDFEYSSLLSTDDHGNSVYIFNGTEDGINMYFAIKLVNKKYSVSVNVIANPGKVPQEIINDVNKVFNALTVK